MTDLTTTRERQGDWLPTRNLFDWFFGSQPLAAGGRMPEGGLPLEIKEEDDALVVRAAVPGFAPEQIDVTVQGDTLTIRGRSETESTDEREGNYHLREWRASSFHRSVTLPTPVASDAAEAEIKHGVLTLRLPVREDAAARRIAVRHDGDGAG
jgi:HSP20 family protein